MIQHKLSPLQHRISLSRDVRHIHFSFPSRSFSSIPTFQSLHNSLLKRIKPLTAQVLIVLHNVAATNPRFIRNFSMICSLQPQLRLDNGSDQRTITNLQKLANPIDSELWTTKTPHKLRRQFDVKKSQILDSSQTKHVPRHTTKDVRHVPSLKKLNRIRNLNHFPIYGKNTSRKHINIRLHRRKLRPRTHGTFSRNPTSNLLNAKHQRLHEKSTDQI